MAEVANGDADEAWKAFKHHLKSSKMATSAGAHQVAHKFLAEQQQRQRQQQQNYQNNSRRASSSSTGSTTMSLKAAEYRTADQHQKQQQPQPPKTMWSRRLSLKGPTSGASGGGASLACHFAKRFGGSHSTDDENKSVTSLPAAIVRTLSPIRSGRRFSFVCGSDQGGPPPRQKRDYRCSTSPPRRSRSYTADQHDLRPQRNLRRGSPSEWDLGSSHTESNPPPPKPTLPPPIPKPEAAPPRSKSVDDIDFANDEVDIDSDGEPIVIRSYVSTGIKVFSDDAGELLEGWGSNDGLLEDFIPRAKRRSSTYRRSSMHASPTRLPPSRVGRRVSMDEAKLRTSLSKDRVPLSLTFNTRRGSIASSVSSNATLSDHFARQEMNSSSLGGDRKSVEELFPKVEEASHEFDDTYIKGIEYLALSRETQIRKLISKSGVDMPAPPTDP